MPEPLAIRTIYRSATWSRCRRYRYALTRWWDDGPWIGWIMLNPSTADDRKDDPTVRRCMSFSRRWGYGGCHIRNLFAFRSTSPTKLLEHPEPIGARNDRSILELVDRCSVIVAAWGVHGAFRDRGREVARRLAKRGVQLYCLGQTRLGLPRHPLYLSAKRRLRVLPID